MNNSFLIPVEVPDFTDVCVSVVGDVMLDRYWQGSTSRISPEAPVPVVHIRDCHDKPGGAGNVAMNIAALDARCQLSGLRGDDEAGEQLESSLAAHRIEHQLFVQHNAPTTAKYRVLSRHQQLIRLDFEDVPLKPIASPLTDYALEHIPHTQALIISDYGKGALSDPQPLIQKAKQHQVPVFIDPKGKDFARYQGATLLTPNLREFEMVMGPCTSDDDIVAKAKKAIAAHDLQGILITRGPDGMTLVRADHPALHLPAHAKEVYDVTGAGDTVIAVLAATFAATHDFRTAAVLANIAASISVTKLGAVSVKPAQLRRALQRLHDTETGIMTENTLKLAIEDAHVHHEKIVFTNGCFDLLHTGHVHYLEQAKALGDKLIVAVNSDESVSRLKGPTRPINSVQQRMSVLASLASVDWVVPFEEDTPARIIKNLLPDVLVKGGDYTIDSVVGADTVMANGGEVKILDFVPDCSTTNVVKKIQEVATLGE